MSAETKIRRLNDLLGAELGRNSRFEPIYRWVWSEDLFYVAPKRDENGDFVCSMVDKDGNILRPIERPSPDEPDDVGEDGAADESLVVTPEPAPLVQVIGLQVDYERKRFVGLNKQWVIAMWCDPGPEPAWKAQFGAALEYPANGYLAPTNMCLGVNEIPDLDVTQEVIGKVREQRKKRYADYIAEAEGELARQEKASADRVMDEISEACTAFGAVPGKKGGVSFPSVESPGSE